MFVEKRGMDVLTVPDCARSFARSSHLSINTHAEFSKSPTASFFRASRLHIETVPRLCPDRPLFCRFSTVPVKYTRNYRKNPVEMIFLH